MRKAVIFLMVVVVIVVMASCSKSVCPAYAGESSTEHVKNQG